MRRHTFVLSSGQLKRLAQSARKQSISQNAVVRAALDQYFEAGQTENRFQQLHDQVEALTRQVELLLELNAIGWSTVSKGQPLDQLAAQGRKLLEKKNP